MYKKTYYQMQTLIRRAVIYLAIVLFVAFILTNVTYKGYKASLDTPLHPIPKNTTNSNK